MSSDSDVISHFSPLDELIQVVYQGSARFVILSSVDDASWTVHVGLTGEEGRWWRGRWTDKDVKKQFVSLLALNISTETLNLLWHTRQGLGCVVLPPGVRRREVGRRIRQGPTHNWRLEFRERSGNSSTCFPRRPSVHVHAEADWRIHSVVGPRHERENAYPCTARRTRSCTSDRLCHESVH